MDYLAGNVQLVIAIFDLNFNINKYILIEVDIVMNRLDYIDTQ